MLASRVVAGQAGVAGGTPVNPWCPHCGDMLPKGAVLAHCPRCGLPLSARAENKGHGRGKAKRQPSIMAFGAVLALLVFGLGGSVVFILYSELDERRSASTAPGTSGETATAVHALETPAAGSDAPSAPPAPSAAAAPGPAITVPAAAPASNPPVASEASIPSQLRVNALTAGGRMSERTIRAAVEKQRQAIEACHRPSKPLERGARSAVTARWVIGRTGNVSNVTLHGGGLTSSGDACLAAALEGLELPAPTSGIVTVSARLELVARALVN